MSVGYGMRRGPAEVGILAVFQKSRSSRALWDDVLESGRSMLVSLLRSGSINRKHRANVFLTVEKVKVLRKMALVREANQ